MSRICVLCQVRDCAHLIDPPRLTPRQETIVAEIRDGEPLKIVAYRLGIAEPTLRRMLHELYGQLRLSGAGSLRRLTLWAMQRQGLLDIDSAA